MKLYIIVRGAKERTESKCVSIAEDLVGKKNVVLLNEPSFAEAHVKCVEIANQLVGFDYVLLLDADVLLEKKDFFEKINDGINDVKNKSVFMLNFKLFDRQCESPVYGTHLYPIISLKKAYPYRHISIGDQKPETQLCKFMARKGLKTYSADQILGFHGFEQYYVDLYRTAFVRAVKYKSHWDFYLPTFYDRKDNDMDFYWSYIGFIDGVKFYSNNQNKVASLSKDRYINLFNSYLEKNNLKEKELLCLNTNNLDLNFYLNHINHLYENNAGWLTPKLIGYNKQKTLLYKVLKKIKRKVLNG